MKNSKLIIWICGIAIAVVVVGFLVGWAWQAATIAAASAAAAKMLAETERRRKAKDSVEGGIEKLMETEKALDAIRDGSDDKVQVFVEELNHMTPDEKIAHAKSLLVTEDE